jgi:UDP-GlcNAc3NAcA epimerase
MTKSPVKILTIVGARPQFVKAAVVSRALSKRTEVSEIIVHTGQHFDSNMSAIFFDEMNIPRPHYALALKGAQHGSMTGGMMIDLEPIMLDEKPDWVLVYGDTNTTLAGALCASKLGIGLVHIEAGLRSFDRAMPEEINRVLTDHVSNLLFAPTESAIDNLKAEGIVKGVHQVGDVMYDATLMLMEEAKKGNWLEPMGLSPNHYDLATLHRASTTETKESLSKAVSALKEQSEGRTLVIPLHPRTKAAALNWGVSLDGLMVLDPVGPIQMHALLAGCHQVFTDSGGLQKEAYFHQKSCITLRDTTEWVETIESGWNRLWTVADFAQPRRSISDYGDGHASEAIVAKWLD